MSAVPPVQIGDVVVGGGSPFALIAGPCVIESEAHATELAARLADIARRHGVKTLVDSTFATPLNVRPLDYGIDLVVHSATKYLGGPTDLLAGVIAGRLGAASLAFYDAIAPIVSDESLEHGNNERLSVENFKSAIGAMFELMGKLVVE